MLSTIKLRQRGLHAMNKMDFHIHGCEIDLMAARDLEINVIQVVRSALKVHRVVVVNVCQH
jgi:hypothetical protein